MGIQIGLEDTLNNLGNILAFYYSLGVSDHRKTGCLNGFPP